MEVGLSLNLHHEITVARLRLPSERGNWFVYTCFSAESSLGDGAAGTDRQFTQEGVGTHYAWAARLAGFPFAGFPFEGFDVFTEFVPNQRITDTSFSSLEGTWTYLFEPEGSGTKLTVVNRVRSFWRIQPFETLLDWLTAKTHDPRLRG